MKLTDYLDIKTALGNKWEVYNELKNKFEKEGIPENIATYKASWVLTPEKLEKISLLAKNEEGLRYKIEIFVDSEEDLKLLGKYLIFNPHTKQIKDIRLILELFKLLENI